MAVKYTNAQTNRLMELGVCEQDVQVIFDDVEERQKQFISLEKQLIEKNRNALRFLINEKHKPSLCQLQEALASALIEEGFTQVVTPTIISAASLEKMGVDISHPLHKQVFWLNEKTCLRPMLAPNLYEVSRQLIVNQKLPLKLFEIGSCFRKESEGKSHLKEFTMINLVEWGTPMEERLSTLKKYISIVMKAAGIDDYTMEEEDSVVYGVGLDVVGSNGLELASTSMGPHPLDDAWKITCTWVGVGFGLERLLMYREKKNGIHSYSRSNVYLDGSCMKIQ